MDGQTQHPIDPAMDREIMEEMREQQQDDLEDAEDDRFDLNQEMQDGYPVPEPDEKQNQHTFIHKAAFGSDNTVRTTYLHEGELGRPLFTVRFLLDMHDISKYYIDQLVKDLGLNPEDNGIANYFWEKIQNITDSGMSNKGFAMNMNVTRRMDATRRKVKENILMKGGGKKNEAQTA